MKDSGPLTELIQLSASGDVISDGSACVMVGGHAYRVRLADLAGLSALVTGLSSNEALALGALRSDLPDTVRVTTRKRLGLVERHEAPTVITRTEEYIGYRPGKPAIALIDFDRKGMPVHVADRLAELGGFGAALIHILPDLTVTSAVWRTSISAGLRRLGAGERIPGSGGVHLYVAVSDGEDIPRFLKDLHHRSWLAGLG